MARKITLKNASSSQLVSIQKNKESVLLNQVNILIGFLVLTLFIRIFVASRYEINWDEFHYLSFVYDYINHILSNSLQTFHVHFFTWLPRVSENEVKQIIAARFIMLLLQLGTGYFIFRISRRYLSIQAALFAVLSYFSVSYNIRMGASFRPDPIAAFFLMASLDLFLDKILMIKKLIVAGILMALALIVTIKSMIYLPTFMLIVIVMLINDKNIKTVTSRVAIVAFSVALSFSLLYLYHRSNILIIDDGEAITTLSGGFNKTVNFFDLLPRWNYLYYTLIHDIPYWLAIAYGIKVVCFAICTKQQLSGRSAIIIATMIIPLCSVLFYRNAFPYFYSFILAPASIFCGVAWDALPWRDKKRNKSILIAGTILFLIFISILRNGIIIPKIKNSDHQSQLLEVVHKAFPTPTQYFDRCSMISSYSQVGFFMSTWGVEGYRNKQNPVLEQTIKNNNPPFYIANIGSLDVENKKSLKIYKQDELLVADLNALKDNYIHHWGEMYVAGKQFNLSQTKPVTDFFIQIHGTYTLESTAKALINGRILLPGESIYLAPGNHTIQGFHLPRKYILRWGEQLYRPKSQPSQKSTFNGF